MSIQDILAVLGAHNYLALFILLALYVRKLTSADSKFPLTIPATWQPSVTAFFGLVYGVLAGHANGQTWGAAVLGGCVAAATGGFLDGLLVAIFNHGAAPAWARAIVFVFDDVLGGGGGGAAKPAPAPVAVMTPPAAPKPPPPAAARRWLPVLGFAALVLAACSQPLFPTLSKIEQAIATDLANGASEQQMEQDACLALGGSALTDAVCVGVTDLVVSVVTSLVSSGSISGKALANAKTYLAAHPKAAH